MPAYGKNLSPAEVDAIVAFMLTLHEPNDSPARDTTAPENSGDKGKETATVRR
jgi:ubiquinol-cytochrome c reductase cytochrome b subunit